MEIFQNTLIKLVVRQGTDSDRKNVVLTSGEIGYTTDTSRTFIGNGILSGGNLVGNLYKGDFVGNTTGSIEPAEFGDLAFNTDSRKLYRLKHVNTGLLSSWSQIGGVYVSNDPNILISSDNEISLEPLSSNSFDNDAVQAPIIIDGNGKIALSSTIPFQIVSTKTILISGGLQAYSDGVNVTGIAVNTLSANLVIDSTQLNAKYNGLNGQVLAYSRGISVSRLSAGDYNFSYGPLPTSNVIPMCQINGTGAFGYEPRVTSADSTICNVQILSSNGIDFAKSDADVYLSIIY